MSNIFETLFYQPILNLLVYLYNTVPGNDLGIAIIFLTVIIKVLLWPLSKQALESQKHLQELQPEMEKIKQKHKDNREALGRAMMEMYKEKKVNPFSSCLPLLIQLPFLFAVFKVFRDGFENGSLDLVYSFIARPELINSISLGIINLNKPNVVLAIAAGAAQFWQVKMTINKKKNDPVSSSNNTDMAAAMNKQMLYLMPGLTIFIGLTLPGGLSLYWLVTTLLTVLQQHYIFQDNTKPLLEVGKK